MSLAGKGGIDPQIIYREQIDLQIRLEQINTSGIFRYPRNNDRYSRQSSWDLDSRKRQLRGCVALILQPITSHSTSITDCHRISHLGTVKSIGDAEHRRT